MKKIFSGTPLVLCAAATVALCQSSPKPADKPAPPAEIRSFDAAAIDKTADPCSDFYQYACGNWMKSNPIPGDQVRWARSFSMLGERNRYLLWQELEAAAKAPHSENEKKFGDFYAACMDTDGIAKQGLKPIAAELDRIAKLKSASELAALMGEMDRSGAGGPLVDFGVQVDDKDSSRQIAALSQAGTSLPDRDYYLVENDHFKDIRAKYLKHVARMLELAGDKPEVAAKEAEDVLRIETALAKAQLSRTDMRDPEKRYHLMKVSELVKLAPDFDFATYFAKVGIGHFDELNVATPSYYEGLNKEIKSEPVSAWKAYLRWHRIHSASRLMAGAIYDENFEFFGRVLSGQKEQTPRWKKCTAATDGALGEAVGQAWVAKNFPPEAKDSMDKLVAALDKSLADDLSTLPWMTEATRKAAVDKLSLFRNKIGYPEKWREYSTLAVDRNDVLGNTERSAAFEEKHNFDKLGKPVDEKEWQMTPPTVNAYYDPSMNDINFPAGILQPPFFDAKIDPAVNFGGIGVVIGHEMTHGFDDEGSQYDGHGNLREWYTEADRKAFVERTNCVADEYSTFEAAPAHDNQPQVKLNGRLTLGENTADNGGLRIAYMALLDVLKDQGKQITDQIDGFTEAQRYFLGFAQVWCQNQTEEAGRQAALVDPHSPGRWRVNGTVQNFDEFGKAFGCKTGAPMMPTKSCRVW